MKKLMITTCPSRPFTKVLLVGVALLAVPTLLRAADPKQDERIQGLIRKMPLPEARRELLEIGEAAVPALITALHDERVVVRNQTANVLREMGPTAKSAIPALIESIESPKLLTRGAVEALGAMGPIASNAVPGLIQLVQSTNNTLIFPVQKSLAGIGEPAIQPLLVLAKGKDSRTRYNAVVALRAMGEPGIEAVLSLLSDSSLEVRQIGGNAIVWLGPPAVPGLIKLVQGGNRAASISAITGLQRLGTNAVPAIPALMGLVERDSGRLPVHVSAIFDLLGRLGPAAKDAVPSLQTLLVSKDFSTRTEAAGTLPRIDPTKSAQCLAVLEPMLDSDPYFVQSALGQMRVMGEAARPALPRLIGLMTAQDSQVRTLAAGLVASLSPEAETRLRAVTLLQEMLVQSSEEKIRETAARTLEPLGSMAVSAVPSLVRALEDSSDQVRSLAAQALGRIGPAAAEAIPALTRLSEAGNSYTSYAAKNALKRIQKSPP